MDPLMGGDDPRSVGHRPAVSIVRERAYTVNNDTQPLAERGR